MAVSKTKIFGILLIYEGYYIYMCTLAALAHSVGMNLGSGDAIYLIMGFIFFGVVKTVLGLCTYMAYSLLMGSEHIY